MPEPIDTIRRVNSGDPMTLHELYRARETLDGYSASKQTDVLEARRLVGSMIADLEPSQSVAAVGGGGVRAESLEQSIYSGSLRPPQEKQQGNPVLGFIVLLVIIGGIFYACTRDDSDSSGESGTSDSESDDGRNPGMAKVMCENFVEDSLKAPSTAEFSGVFDTVISGTGNDYTVSGYVDAQNGFSAMIRNNYNCQIHDNGDDRWSLVSLTGLG
jgi:hypothetical protein